MSLDPNISLLSIDEIVALLDKHLIPMDQLPKDSRVERDTEELSPDDQSMVCLTQLGMVGATPLLIATNPSVSKHSFFKPRDSADSAAQCGQTSLLPANI